MTGNKVYLRLLSDDQTAERRVYIAVFAWSVHVPRFLAAKSVESWYFFSLSLTRVCYRAFDLSFFIYISSVVRILFRYVQTCQREITLDNFFFFFFKLNGGGVFFRIVEYLFGCWYNAVLRQA